MMRLNSAEQFLEKIIHHFDEMRLDDLFHEIFDNQGLDFYIELFFLQNIVFKVFT